MTDLAGYKSSPESYIIHVDKNEAVLIENGLVTAKDAQHLDFDFQPVTTSTPNQ